MKAKRIIGLAAAGFVAIAVAWWVSHRDRSNLTGRAVTGISQPASHPATATSNGQLSPSAPPRDASPEQTEAWDYRTVEEEMSNDDLRQHMQEWAREGWAVLAISRPLPQPDGTLHRKVELRRARK